MSAVHASPSIHPEIAGLIEIDKAISHHQALTSHASHTHLQVEFVLTQAYRLAIEAKDSDGVPLKRDRVGR